MKLIRKIVFMLFGLLFLAVYKAAVSRIEKKDGISNHKIAGDLELASKLCFENSFRRFQNFLNPVPACQSV